MASVWTVRRDGTEKTGDDFSAYVRARGDALLRFAYVPTGDHADAQDAVQIALSRGVAEVGSHPGCRRCRRLRQAHSRPAVG